jgi:hypothetical protein
VAAEVIRAVLDTSVLVPKTSRQDLQQIADLGLYEGVWSSWIVAELNRALTIRWLKANNCDLSDGALRIMSAAAKTMMRIMLDTLIMVDPPLPHAEPWDALADEDDAPIWGTAVASEARYAVSEDTQHYPPADEAGRHYYQDIEYLGGKEFIRLLLGEEAKMHGRAVQRTQ